MLLAGFWGAPGLSLDPFGQPEAWTAWGLGGLGLALAKLQANAAALPRPMCFKALDLTKLQADATALQAATY